MNFETISVVGLGYIGLPTAAVIASRRTNVIGLDISQRAVDIINEGKIHIVEPELDMLVHAAVTEGYLRATTVAEPADAFLIAVPTPLKGDHQPDLSYIESAAKAIAPVLKKGDLVVLESTSPVGSTESMAEWLVQERPDLSFPQTHGESSDIRIAYCPERVLPGHVVRELVENDRVVGGMTSKCSRAAVALYQIFVRGRCIETSVRTAEMTKLTENSFRDVNIAFANELSIICDKLNIDVWELIGLANHHPRVNILNPGPGVGGHCIAVDPWFIVSQTPELANLIRTAREVNESKPEWVVERIKLALAEQLQIRSDKSASDVTISIFGLAFKADIDDLRESPALSIAGKIAQSHPGPVLIAEPNIEELPRLLEGKAKLVELDCAIENADIAVMLVDHKEFKGVSIADSQDTVIIDTRGIWTT